MMVEPIFNIFERSWLSCLIWTTVQFVKNHQVLLQHKDKMAERGTLKVEVIIPNPPLIPL